MRTLYQVLSRKEKLILYGIFGLIALAFVNMGQVVSYNDFYLLVASGVPLLVFIIVTNRKYRKKGKTRRRSFSRDTKEHVLQSQNYRCKHCYKPFEHTDRGIGYLCDFDHIHGRNDDSFENCQALCPNCHARKTRENR